ncbi:MAG: DUF4071 domain-containing protein [Candidatus Magnetomorum sp.]|nr:DUF4071 domain-containing protein [Candidatus Magnetomorum sp.]
MSTKPSCFVFMTFGQRKLSYATINFNTVYTNAILPAIESSGMEPVCVDVKRIDDQLHKTIIERLLLSDVAIIDLTTANANLFFTCGIRYAIRPSTTLFIFAQNQGLRFNMQSVHSIPYHFSDTYQFETQNAQQLKLSLIQQLTATAQNNEQHILFEKKIVEILEGYKPLDIARLKTDTFRDQIRYSEKIKQSLAEARNEKNQQKLLDIQASLGDLNKIEAGVAVDLLLSYRAVEAWPEMVYLYECLSESLKRSVLVREQIGFAYNRLKERDLAIDILELVLKEQGESSETCSLLGRVYKDKWIDAQARDQNEAITFLDKAIEKYVQGFEADWRDAYPGINALTLLDIKGDPSSIALKQELLPVVRFAVNQRLKHGTSDYWDYATLLELAVLENDPQKAQKHLDEAKSYIREIWEPKSTANNLRMIDRYRCQSFRSEKWVKTIIEQLEQWAS